jgi:hypothetical protein
MTLYLLKTNDKTLEKLLNEKLKSKDYLMKKYNPKKVSNIMLKIAIIHFNRIKLIYSELY